MTVGQAIALVVLVLSIIAIVISLPAWAVFALIAGLAIAILVGTVPLIRT